MRSVFVYFLFLCGMMLQSQLVADETEYQYLDRLALASGADKGSSYHNYTEIYSRYFGTIKEKPLKFLEIGIWKGYSVKMWEDYFPNAALHFIDITFQNVEYYSSRSHYHLVDQSNAQQLREFAKNTGGAFDIIIDDGGHQMKQQIVSFQTLFPHLKSGGIYIIEDLHTSYWDGGWGGEYTGEKHFGTTVAFLKSLIDEVNHVGATTKKASHRNLSSSVLKKLNNYQKEIESIHFYDSVAVIIKR